MCLWSSLDCKQPPFQHKAFIRGLSWCLPRGNPTSHGEGQEEWERLPWQWNRVHSPERPVQPLALGLGSGVLKE